MLEFPVQPQHPTGCPFDPPPAYKNLLEQVGLSTARLWSGVDAWLVARYDEFKDVCGNVDFSSDVRRPNYPHGSAGSQPLSRSIITVDDPEHWRLRRPMAPFFAKPRMERIGPSIEQLAEELIDAMIAGGSSADLVATYAKPIPSLVVFQLLGLPPRERAPLHDLLGVLFGAQVSQETARAATDEFEARITRFVQGEGIEPDGMIASLRGKEVESGALTLEEVRDFVMILIVGGFESTANTIGEAVALLLLHPGQLNALQRDPSLWPNAVEEILRFTAVTHRGRRRVATVATDIGGQVIEPGDAVIALEAAANRDPRKFEDPDVFDIHRPNARQHLAFGFGPHLCLGAPLARVELHIALTTLFRRLPELALAVSSSDLDFLHDWHLRGLRSLPVTW